MQPARLAHLLEFAAQLAHPGADHAAVGLDLRFARTAEKPETAALTFEVRPAPHEPALLVIEMRQFDLKPPLGRRGALAENLQDQPGAVDDLALELFFEVTLLDRGQRAVDDDEIRLFLLAGGRDPLDLAFAEQRAGPNGAYRNDRCLGHHDPDGKRETLGLLEARLGILGAALAADVGANDQRPRAARDAAFDVVVERQPSSPS